MGGGRYRFQRFTDANQPDISSLNIRMNMRVTRILTIKIAPQRLCKLPDTKLPPAFCEMALSLRERADASYANDRQEGNWYLDYRGMSVYCF